jgi:hypothetical protein
MRIAGGRVLASINDGPLLPAVYEVDQQVLDISSDRATKPDPAWSLVDDAGHFHAFDADGSLPTLDGTRVPMPCDGSCGGVCEGEGYSVTRYTCRACGQEVRPVWVPDVAARTATMPGMKDWSVQVEFHDQPPPQWKRDDLVSVRLEDDPEGVRFGLGYCVGRSVARGLDGVVVTVTISGAGPLGTRMVPAKVPG